MKIRKKIRNIVLFMMLFNPEILRMDIVSTMQDYFFAWLNELISGLISIFNNFVEGLSSIFLSALSSVVFGFLGFVGVPFTSWSQYVANNGGWFIPIIFVSILGIAFLVAEGINIVYGFEKDISQGEADVGTEEQHIAEEEEEA